MASTKDSGSPRLHGRRERRKQVTRQELLAAGRRLFAEKGLYDSRVEDLSRHAGIAKGTLYGYFANKEELIEAVVTNGFSELLGHVHRAIQGARSRDDSVVRIVEAHLSFFEDNPDLMRVFHQVRGLLKFDHPDWRPLRRVLAKYIQGLAQVLAFHPSRRSASAASDTEVALLLFGAISGVTSMRAATASVMKSPARPKATARALQALVRAFDG